MPAAKVYLVGAGPGHPELLTLKAAELIKTADVIVYDRLIQEEVLALARPDADRIYMGKPVGRHESRQDEANELMVRLAREGKAVVRLKGGDPFVFGRGGEEAEYLAGHGVPFEVVPGVCAAVAAPLAAGIPVTHRDFASSVAIVTGHNAEGNGHRIDWAALARIDTVVFLMGVHNAGHIAMRLIENGRSPNTPAAVIQMAFWHDERVACGTLATIADVVHDNDMKPPATLVVGDVVRVRDKLQASQRDLKRRPDDALHFQPGPSPDQLLRMACGGMEAQLLGWALDVQLFDHLEEPVTTYDLAQRLRLRPEALVDLLAAFAALLLLESRPEGYRNLELASRYLTTQSAQSLRDWLLYNCARVSSWEALAEFASRGQLAPTASDRRLHHAACESVARFVAPAAVEAIAAEFPPRTALVIGWGESAWSRALRRRWPEIAVTGCNPLTGSALADCDCDLIILAGVLEGGDAAVIDYILQHLSSAACAGAEIVLDATIVAIGSVPGPELALRILARQVSDGGYRPWTTERLNAVLERHGLAISRTQASVAGQTLVFITKAQPKALAATAR